MNVCSVAVSSTTSWLTWCAVRGETALSSPSDGVGVSLRTEPKLGVEKSDVTSDASERSWLTESPVVDGRELVISSGGQACAGNTGRSFSSKNSTDEVPHERHRSS